MENINNYICSSMKYCFRKPELLQNLRVYENGELNRAAIMAFHPDPENG